MLLQIWRTFFLWSTKDLLNNVLVFLSMRSSVALDATDFHCMDKTVETLFKVSSVFCRRNKVLQIRNDMRVHYMRVLNRLFVDEISKYM